MNISESFRSQYAAALEMMRHAIQHCPDFAWDDERYGNRSWHIAYHALFYAALYLSPGEDVAEMWEKARPHHQWLSKSAWTPELGGNVVIPYSKVELLEFTDYIESRLATAFDQTPYDAPSGFSWISFNRFQLHIYNLRHLQHHIGQLSERVRQTSGQGTGWVGRK